MPIDLQGEEWPLSSEEVGRLWKATYEKQRVADDMVAVRLVSTEEIQALNKSYRNKDAATNVLSFSYPSDPLLESGAEHEVVLCLVVAQREAEERGQSLRDYVALLLTHAFLHVAGMDHERSADEAGATEKAEAEILETAGFTPRSL